jgi:drug/metabolite transporter (DMT)-like permease
VPAVFIIFNLLVFGFCIWLFIFWIQMLIDVIRHQEKDKALWVIVIVLGNSIGAIVYYFAARKPRITAAQTNIVSNIQPTAPTAI